MEKRDPYVVALKEKFFKSNQSQKNETDKNDGT